MFPIHRLHLVALLVVLLVALPATVLADDLKVVATLPSLGALARDVGGDHVEVVVLATRNEDPHYVDPRPNYVLELNSADLVVLNGMELEIGWLPPLLTQCRNPDLGEGKLGYLDASTVIDALDLPTGKVDRARGDVHASGNPHYLFDARAGARIAGELARRFAELDPDHADIYLARGVELTAELEAFAAAQAERFATLPQASRRIVAYHDSLSYLRDWLGLDQVATIEPLPGVAPDPQQVVEVLQTIKDDDARLIVQERFYPSATAEKLAELSDATLVVLEGNADFAGGQHYIDYLEELTDALYDAAN